MRNEPAKLSITTLGHLTVRCGERPLAIVGRKARALLGYLAISETHEETRERLVGLLWSEVDESNARASLRQTLREIRAVFEAAAIAALRTDKVSVGLDPSLLHADLPEVLKSAKASRVHPRLLEVERALEHLLDDFESVDPAFRIWLLAKRQALHDRILRYLESALGAAADPVHRAELARAIHNLDPTHEGAVRMLIRISAEAGDMGGALGIYKMLWDRLEDEYDVEPSQETQELVAAIRLSQPDVMPAARVDGTLTSKKPGTGGAIVASPPPQSGVARKRWPKLMLSVGDFNGSATRQENLYLVEGFRRELIACLVRFREWVVRDATFASASATSPDDGDAEYMIEASAFEAATALRLVITLRDPTTHAYLWSERINISVSNWFEAQQHVVRRITTALNVHLSAERIVAIAHRPPGDMKAYDLWLLGQATFLSFDPKNWEKARNLFREVVAQMPDFAPAYSSLAQLNNSEHIVRPGVFRDLRRSEESLMYAREAARLDPIDSRSQLCLGWSHAAVKQYEHAMIYIPLAYELNENDPWTLVSSAWCFAACGQYTRAQELADHTLRLPLAPSPLQWSYHAAIRFVVGDYQGCVQAAVAAGEVSLSALGYKVAALLHLGDRDAATTELQRYLKAVRSRWIGTEPASDANIARWLLHMAPIKRSEDWQRLRDGVAGAGAPVEGLAHDQW